MEADIIIIRPYKLKSIDVSLIVSEIGIRHQNILDILENNHSESFNSMVASEKSLEKDWNAPEENEAWEKL